jgi:hypothetical protein
VSKQQGWLSTQEKQTMASHEIEVKSWTISPPLIDGDTKDSFIFSDTPETSKGKIEIQGWDWEVGRTPAPAIGEVFVVVGDMDHGLSHTGEWTNFRGAHPMETPDTDVGTFDCSELAQWAGNSIATETIKIVHEGFELM